MQTNTQLNGLQHVTANTAAQDGDTCLLVNLRKKDLSLQPVTEGTPIAQLSQDYDLIYIHTNNLTQNWIAVKDDTLYTDIKTTPVQICQLSTPITQIQAIGNTLMLFTETGIYYLLYKNNAYIRLGYKPPFPYLKSITCNVSRQTTDFTSIEGEITDVQAAVEAIVTKNRWKEESAWQLCGAYLITYALRLFDGSYILPASPLFIYPTRPLVHPYFATLAYDGKNFKPEESSATASLFNITASFDTKQLADWSDIILSIDLFISGELGIITENYQKIEDAIIDIQNPVSPQRYKKHIIRPLAFELRTISQNIDNINNFYLIRSISIKTDTPTATFPQKADGSVQNLVHQPTLPIDDFTHHNITAGYTYIYNQRLHMANIKTNFTKGFDLRAFIPCNNPNGLEHDAQTKEITPFPQQSYTKAHIQIYINNNQTTQTTSLLTTAINVKFFYINPFISYPDSRAYRAEITITDINNIILGHKTLELKPHPYLNIAYYIDPSLSETKINIEGVSVPPLHFTDYSDPFIQTIEENKIKVSALQNPFIFPVENTYIAGNGKTIALASNSIPVSQGQFGQYPLYAFTTDGIYILAVGTGNIVYANIAPVSEEIAIAGTVHPVTGGVFFLTNRGAFIIAGSQTTPISAPINTNTLLQNIQHYDQILNTLLPGKNIRIQPFLNFITANHLTIHFNYIQNEIIIASASDNFAYVYNLNSRSWHTTTHTFTPVQNCYPHLFGIVDRKVLDISAETDIPAPVLLLTRPLKFTSQQFKTLQRHILRAYISTPSPAGLFTHSGNDAVNFTLKTNKRIAPGQHRDIDTGLIPFNKYRFFTLMFLGYLQQDSRIDFIISTIYPVYNNDKNR